MKFVRLFIFLSTAIACTSPSYAASGSSGTGLSLGVGVPFITQAALNHKFSDTFSFEIGYNQLSIDVGSAKVELTMPELMVNYHPFKGSFFLGLGVGQQSLMTKATDALTSLEAKAEVSGTTTVLKTGWMWGVSNGGFWFGMDISYISPSGAEVTITAPGLNSNDTAYIDTQDAAKKFGETAYANITFARLGWLF